MTLAGVGQGGWLAGGGHILAPSPDGPSTLDSLGMGILFLLGFPLIIIGRSSWAAGVSEDEPAALVSPGFHPVLPGTFTARYLECLVCMCSYLKNAHVKVGEKKISEMPNPHPFPHSFFMQQMLTKHLLCARPWGG